MNKFTPTIFTSIDLEMNMPSRKIIQIGACVGNVTTGEIIDRLTVFINPNEKLDDFIVGLTKITQEQVDYGVSLKEGYEKLAEMHKKHKSFVNFVQWGGGDSQCLKEQLKEDNIRWIAGRRDIDVKTLYVAWRLAQGQPPNGGLSRAMKNLGIEFKGQAHNALWDAENTFKAFCILVNKYKT